MTTERLSPADRMTFCKLVRQGLTQRQIADALGFTPSGLANEIYRHMDLYRVWRDARPARNHLANRVSREKKRKKKVRPQAKPKPVPDNGGPIDESLREIAALALEARRKREEDVVKQRADAIANDETMAAACKAKVDDRGCVCISEVAESLGWQSSFAFRVAMRLMDAGRFPYRFKAREVAETPDEADVPMVSTHEIWGENVPRRRSNKPDFSEENAKLSGQWRARPPETTEEARAELGRWVHDEIRRCKRLAIKSGWVRKRKKREDEKQSKAA